MIEPSDLSGIDARFDELMQRKEAQFQMLLEAIHEWNESKRYTREALAALSERVAVLEAARH